MRMTGEQQVGANRQKVWQALNDPDVLGRCIPGCQSVEKHGADRFDVLAEVKIGPIGARFKGAVAMTEIDPPNGCTISGQGQGGIAGSARGTARVSLSDAAGGTRIAYEVDAEVGGRLAQLGGPIIEATARQMADRFFANFAREVMGEPQAMAEAAGAASPVTAPTVMASPVTAGGFPWTTLIVVLAALVCGFLLGRAAIAPPWVLAVACLVVLALAAGFEAGRRGAGKP